MSVKVQLLFKTSNVCVPLIYFYLNNSVDVEPINLIRVIVGCKLWKLEAGYLKFVNSFLSSSTLA